MFDWIFSFFHVGLLIAVVVYAVYSLFHANTLRFVLLMLCLTVYYFLVLHKAVRREIERKRKIKFQRGKK